MDTIFIRDLRVETVVGIWRWERSMSQTVSIDLDMATDVSVGAAQDSIEAALDYRAVSKRVSEFVSVSSYQLIETMAEEIARLVREEFEVRWVRVSVHKPYAVSGSRDVGVIIERGKR